MRNQDEETFETGESAAAGAAAAVADVPPAPTDGGVQHLTDVKFSSLAMDSRLRQGVEAAGFKFCTPIQAGSLPLALAGADVEGQAQTGTGKTAAFLLAAMHRLLTHEPANDHTDGQPRTLILAPTRELAIQIHADAKQLGQFTPLRCVVCFGGTGYESQQQELRDGVDILIGTPGRLIDFYKQRLYGLNSIEVAIIDEADRMFDLGFIKDVRYMFRRMPPPAERLNMLFSATLSHRVSELAYEHMNSPEVINANPEEVTVSRIKQALFHVASEDKMKLLVGLIRRAKGANESARTIVFVNTKRISERIKDTLEANGTPSALLTGDVPQNKRMSLLKRFKAGELSVLVATDVAARGLHIPDVTHVVNFDLPQDAEDYVHRCGRTARAGASGEALSMACEQYVYSLPDIEDYIGAKVPAEPITDELQPDIVYARARKPRDDDPRGRRPRRGGGGGGAPRRAAGRR